MLGRVPLGQVGQDDKGGSGYSCILFGQDDEAEVAVLASNEVVLNGHCACHQ